MGVEHVTGYEPDPEWTSSPIPVESDTLRGEPPGRPGLLLEGLGPCAAGRDIPMGRLTLSLAEIVGLLKRLSESLELLITDADLRAHWQSLQV